MAVNRPQCFSFLRWFTVFFFLLSGALPRFDRCRGITHVSTFLQLECSQSDLMVGTIRLMEQLNISLVKFVKSTWRYSVGLFSNGRNKNSLACFYSFFLSFFGSFKILLSILYLRFFCSSYWLLVRVASFFPSCSSVFFIHSDEHVYFLFT